MIGFNAPCVTGHEIKYIKQVIDSGKMAGNGVFSKQCEQWFVEKLGCVSCLLTPSCTAALEMTAILIDIKPGDEVIMPSYTFVSTANAFVLRGAKIVFVDIRPDTLNIDETKLEHAITSKTKAIVVVHYAGVGCDMEQVMNVAIKHDLFVIEDAAQAIMSTYKNQALGSFGHLATFSFHETKNITSGGEGGALIINDPQFIERAKIIREKGTNRSLFCKGVVDKYSWVDIGSSYLPSEVQAAYLYAQLELADKITENRLAIWNMYHEAFAPLAKKGVVEIATVPFYTQHNGHIFYIKVCLKSRDKIIDNLKKTGVQCAFHYIPLHSSSAGKKHSIFKGLDMHTTKESLRIIRLPLWYLMPLNVVDETIEKIKSELNLIS